MSSEPCELCLEEMKRFAAIMQEDNEVFIEVDGQLVTIEYGKLDIGIWCWHNGS